ncbi:MAG TPA: transglutaminase-like domain-containing protein [Gemmatimonadales bacterium]|nr:transglutaminase-like domain-containing protein [Gemmatimonadales bacterium]
MTRRTLATSILVVWALSLGWLVKRLAFRPAGARLAEAALSVPPGATYYRLTLGGQQVGFASSTIDTALTSIRVTDLQVLRFPARGVLQRSAVLTRATLSRALRLQSLDGKFTGDVGRFTAKGTVSGDTLLTLRLVSGTDSETTRVPLAPPVVLPAVLPLYLAFGGELKPGRTYASGVFDPVRLAERPIRVVVARESTFVVPDSAGYDSTAMAWIPVHFDTVRAFRISQTEGGVTTDVWIDGEGRVVRAQTPAGFTIERSAFEIAYENFRHRDTVQLVRASAASGSARGSIVPMTALAARAPLPAPPPHATLALLRVGVSGGTLAGFELTGGRQRLVGDTLEVRRETSTQLAARYALPARDTAFRTALAPEPLIQRDDPRIQAQARLIVGGERDPARVARLINDWVHRTVERRASGGIPSATQALELRRGDCNEHTVLYVALARAAGLPARTAAGLVYLGGRFYYHAWPEVYLGDWVAVDPTFGQFPADAAHVRLAVGGLARQLELLRLVGSLKLAVL